MAQGQTAAPVWVSSVAMSGRAPGAPSGVCESSPFPSAGWTPLAGEEPAMDLFLEDGEDVGLPRGHMGGRWDLPLFVSTAASSGLCGGGVAAFSSDRVTLNTHRPGGRGVPGSESRAHVPWPRQPAILMMHSARHSPKTRLPAYPNPFIFPPRPLGSKFLTLL